MVGLLVVYLVWYGLRVWYLWHGTKKERCDMRVWGVLLRCGGDIKDSFSIMINTIEIGTNRLFRTVVLLISFK